MLKSIDYKSVKNKVVKKNVCLCILVVLIILEAWSFSIVEQNTQPEVANQYTIKDDLNLNTIIKELERNEMDIVNMNKKSRGYEFKVAVSGTKEEVKKKVDQLDNFNISSYELQVKDKLIKGTLTISTIS